MAAAVEFVPEPRDLLALNTVLGRRGGPVRSLPLLAASLIGAAAALAAALTEWDGGARWPIPVAAVLGGGMGWLLARVVGAPVERGSARLLARVAWAGARRRGLLVPQRVEITPEGLRVRSAIGETLARWPEVREVVRTEEHLFVFVSRQVAFVAPRRAFAGREDFEAFGREAEERWRRAGGA